MPDIINILPDSVANQIAAGEVVDRPASAVKELLENALDAGASKIQLIIKDAGRTLLQVIDNGCGMSDSDARLCFERHATSKIHNADDLFAIHTMGFRGEALASIAAVAQVELRSKMHDNELGTQVIIEGSQIVSQTTCSCANGTSIAVKNLFFNIPVRRNFLKKDSIELVHIEDIFKRVALVNHAIDYQFYSNGKLLYDLHAGNFAERICQIFGGNSRERFFPVNEQTDIARIHGYVAKPEYARRSRGEQYLFVNHRFIKHPMLSAAVEKAYTDLIPDRYYPGYFLHIDIDPSRIDVNVHPTKTEVKFIDEQPLFTILRAATKKALGQFALANEIEFNPCQEVDFAPAPPGYIPPQPTPHYNPHYNPFHSTSGNTAPHTFATTPRPQTFPDPASEHRPDTPLHTLPSGIVPPTENPSAPSSLCLQLHNRYIVGTLPSGLLVVDQQAAHERVLFDRLMAREHHAAAQQLLFPVNCQFSPAGAEILSELLPEINNSGFEVNPIGQTTFVVTATPPDVSDSELQQLFDQLVQDYSSAMMQHHDDRTQCLCRTLARQMSVKAGTSLQQEEMQQILADLFCCQVPNVSPSGTKILTVIPDNQLIQQ